MTEGQNRENKREKILTTEQEEVLEAYILRLDEYFQSVKEAEKTRVEIETLHLKRILTK